MATGNFHYEEVLYTITGCDDDEFIWEDTRNNIADELSSNKDFYINDKIEIDSELSSFPATSIGEFSDSIYYLSEELDVQVILMTRSGYYEGFNLDYEIRFSWDGIIYDSIDDMYGSLSEYADYKGLFVAHQKSLYNKIEAKLNEFTSKIEQAYKLFSDETKVVAQFSNGETMYEKVS